MTTVASSHGPTEVINARRTESVDAPAILQLIAQRTHAQFGRVNIVHLIEKSNLSVTLSNEENEVLGFAGFLDHPQIEVCDPADWPSWMKEAKYDLADKSTPLNSLFLHYFVAKDDYTIGCASEIVRTVFNAVPELRFIFLVLPLGTQPEPALGEIFHPLKAEGHNSLYVCQRHNHVPLLHIRQAVVEDHDDLTPLFKRLNNNLTETYGNYFLAEMIEAQDEDNHALVAEVGGKAVGFMSICSHVNVKFLQDCFELNPFHGLCKPHENDILKEEYPETSETEEPSSSDSAPVQTVPSTTSVSEIRDQPSNVSIHSVSDVADKPGTASHEERGSILAPTPSDHGVTPAPSQASLNGAVLTSCKPKLSEAHMGTSSASLVLEETLEETGNSETEEEEDVFLNDKLDSDTEKQHPFEPTYAGESNVFSIQLFCISEQFEMRSSDFLPEIFKFFPNKDIAVITVPHLVPEFPLIQQFVRVTPKPIANVPHELYVFHRHGLINSHFRVRLACTVDYEQVEKLVANIDMNEHLLEDLRRYNSARRDADGTEIQAYVADCLGQIVGICIIRREEYIEHIRSHYNIEDFIYFNHHRRDEHGHLHHFVLNPIFQHYSKHFLKEVLRQGHKSCLYYPLYPNYTEQDCVNKHSLATGLNFMVPVRARRQIDYPLEELGINAPSKRVTAKFPLYALNHINRKLTLEPKVTINARVVVIGASDVGIAFLESICFCPHLRFNNLTLISKRGLPDSLHSSALSYTSDDLAYLSLRSWVNVVQGIMTAIDRSKKQVVMSDGARVSYDHLILCTGQQYQIPAPTGADVENSATNHDLSKSAVNRPLDINLPAPENVMALNDDWNLVRLRQWGTKMSAKMDKENNQDTASAVVVYGRTFDAYVTVQDLLSSGVQGSRIVLARPPTHNSNGALCDDGCNGDPFNEPIISDAVAAGLTAAGVRVLDDHVLARWDVEPTNTGTKITAVAFTTPTKPLLSLSCLGLVSLHPRRIDHRTFLACNDACLVFDGRLAIDSNFKTNDPAIRAAGSMTKYARRYHADGYGSKHENFNSREIGFRLAMTVLPLFDPTLDGTNEQNEPPPPTPATTVKPGTPGTMLTENPHDKLVPVYTDAKVTYGQLPGGYKYLHVRKPGERPAYTAQLESPEHGDEIVTGSSERGNYFRLHISQYRRVETVTCLVRQDAVQLPMTNIVRLFGVHERYLNNLLSRVNEGLISDLYAFFREPWALALFHDRFQDFRQEVRDLLSCPPSGASSLSSLEADVRQLVEEDFNVNNQQRATLRERYAATGQRKAVEARLLSFLSYNYYHLPMYAKPGMV
ncbi:cilia- and flagella-associated protein 61-like isoform X1 [Clavelina lepadiformis]|uniref:cilia- and flagella-associated protein 61-like isoform X1 n=1 Tax=Clavelina lepadiformis TaxID=159417 RepID=UPI004041EEFD